jgi:hypothetical protein
MEKEIGERVIETRLLAAVVIFREAVPCTVPFFAMMVTVPAADAVANPAPLTAAMAESEELHCTELVTSFVVLSERCAVAANC